MLAWPPAIDRDSMLAAFFSGPEIGESVFQVRRYWYVGAYDRAAQSKAVRKAVTQSYGATAEQFRHARQAASTHCEPRSQGGAGSHREAREV